MVLMTVESLRPLAMFIKHSQLKTLWIIGTDIKVHEFSQDQQITISSIKEPAYSVTESLSKAQHERLDKRLKIW